MSGNQSFLTVSSRYLVFVDNFYLSSYEINKAPICGLFTKTKVSMVIITINDVVLYVYSAVSFL